MIIVNQNSVWLKAQTLKLQVSENILPEFDIGFDKRIPKDVEEELRSFVKWVENNYHFPITLWYILVDCRIISLILVTNN